MIFSTDMIIPYISGITLKENNSAYSCPKRRLNVRVISLDSPNDHAHGCKMELTQKKPE